MAVPASPGPMRQGGSEKLVVTPVCAAGQRHIWQRSGAQSGSFRLHLYAEQARNLLNKTVSPLAQAQQTAAFRVAGLSKRLPNQGIPVPPWLSRCLRASSEWGMLFSPHARNGCLSVPIKGHCLISSWADVQAGWKQQPGRNPWQSRVRTSSPFGDAHIPAKGAAPKHSRALPLQPGVPAAELMGSWNWASAPPLRWCFHGAVPTSQVLQDSCRSE